MVKDTVSNLSLKERMKSFVKAWWVMLAVAAAALCAAFFWFAQSIFGGPKLHEFADLGEAMNVITLPALALSIYFASQQLSEARTERGKNDRDKRILLLLDAKERAIQNILWDTGMPEKGYAEGLPALSSIASFLMKTFSNEDDLSERGTHANGQPYHPLWIREEHHHDNLKFYFATSAYAEVVKSIFCELTSIPAEERTLTLLNVASRFSKDECTVLYISASTLPGIWQEIRDHFVSLRFLKWLPQAKILRMTYLVQKYDWGISDDAFKAD